ncbi:MAG: adenosylmethionine--8-amino-7-oxononanoate transaminase [Polyangia bacterium]|jgi:adenosylmethionine-8-amino-7-oxononanoate aminotransferase
MNLDDLDRRYLWHPFTPMREWLAEPPLVIERAEGNELIDTQGRRYLDGVSSLWVNVHGHGHRAINAAIAEQLGKVAHTTLLGLASTPSILLAEKLVSIAPPGLSRVFFSDSGSTAVEVALKIAFQFQQLRGFSRRATFLALQNAYHGDTIGSVSLGGIDTFHRIFQPLLFHTIHVTPTIDDLQQAFSNHGHELAAFVLEPVLQGAAGMLLQPPGFLRQARSLCNQHGVLLVADEVATGFGRTGTMFACQQEGVTPDLLALAKGLSGGYLPVAATMATDEIFHQFLGLPEDRLTFFHGHSFGGNALGCAAALASLDLFEHEHTLANLPPKIAALRARLNEKISPLPHVYEVRQKGLMVGIDLRRSRSHAYSPQEAIGARVCRIVRRHGVILRPLGSVVVLMPPLSITPAQIDRIVDATAAAITEATSDPPLTLSATLPSPPLHSTALEPLRGIFLVGTDTGVGKTTVGVGLLALARARGFAPVPFKPVETGAAPDPEDALRLRSAAGRDDLPREIICPYAFPTPVAPALAAEQASTRLTLADILAAARRAAAHGDFLLVESAGGVLSPYSEDLTAADVAAALGLPLLLVARNTLGTINHTALAVAELRRRHLPLAGVLFVNTTAESTPDRAHNPRFVHALTAVRVLGTLPFLPLPTSDGLAAALRANVEVDVVFPNLK